MFHECNNLSNLKALKNLNLSNAVNLSIFFEYCGNISDLKFC